MAAALELVWSNFAMGAKKCATLLASIDPFRKHHFLDTLGKRCARDGAQKSPEDEKEPKKRRKLSQARKWISQGDVKVSETAAEAGGGPRGRSFSSDVFESAKVVVRAARQGRRILKALRNNAVCDPSRPSSLNPKRKGVQYEDDVLDVWRKTDGLHEVLRTGPRNSQVTFASLQSLRGNSWVNDEVVNCYLRLLQLRPSASSKIHIMSSYFYTQLTNGKYNYGNVRRWTKRDPALTKDTILLPVNLHDVHWVLAVARLKLGVIELYNSMPSAGSSKKVFQNMTRWLHDEQLDKKIDLKIDKWKEKHMPVPQQGDSTSCGVFACAFAEKVVASETPVFNFSQNDIRELRLGIAADILAGSVD